MEAHEGELVWHLIERGIAISNVIHFASWLPQVVPLLGSKGLEPAHTTLSEAAKKYKEEDYDPPAALNCRVDR